MPKLTFAFCFINKRILIRFLFALLMLVQVTCLHAQLCTGSLGDPVVNITFGTGDNTNFVPPSGYTYISSSCPNDGYYTITNGISACFGNTWFAIPSDHTGRSGNFLLINASYSPGDFFLTTITDLCPDTNYEFAAWIMNVVSASNRILPNVTFTIELPDGTILQEYSTGNINQTSSPQWKQYGFYFTTPPDNAAIVLRMRNNAPGGIGNDLALDDITFRPCGAVVTSSIQENSDTVNLCEGEDGSFVFNGNASSAYNDPAFQWQLSTDTGTTWRDIPDATTNTYTRLPELKPGTYLYRFAATDKRFAGVTSCRIFSNILSINVHANPYVYAGPDRITILGDTIHLAGTVTGEDPIYYWSPSDYLNNDSITKPVALPQKSTGYTLYAETAFGCRNNDNVLVKVVNGIYVPSAFTPNNDGKNDRWHIPYLDPQFGAEVSVYNRYGQLVYHTKGEVVDWDGTFGGKIQPSSVYIYQIRFNSNRPIMKGTITLIR